MFSAFFTFWNDWNLNVLNVDQHKMPFSCIQCKHFNPLLQSDWLNATQHIWSKFWQDATEINIWQFLTIVKFGLTCRGCISAAIDCLCFKTAHCKFSTGHKLGVQHWMQFGVQLSRCIFWKVQGPHVGLFCGMNGILMIEHFGCWITSKVSFQRNASASKISMHVSVHFLHFIVFQIIQSCEKGLQWIWILPHTHALLKPVSIVKKWIRWLSLLFEQFFCWWLGMILPKNMHWQCLFCHWPFNSLFQAFVCFKSWTLLAVLFWATLWWWLVAVLIPLAGKIEITSAKPHFCSTFPERKRSKALHRTNTMLPSRHF